MRNCNEERDRVYDNYHNAQVVTVELNMKMQFTIVKTISGSSMVRQHFPS